MAMGGSGATMRCKESLERISTWRKIIVEEEDDDEKEEGWMSKEEQ